MDSQSRPKGVYAGSYDPVTLGQIDIMEQAARLVSTLYVVVGVNFEKNPIFTPDEREAMLKHEIADHLLPRLKAKGIECDVEVMQHSGLTTKFMMAHDAPVFIRGERGPEDYEAEFSRLLYNRKNYPEFLPVHLSSSTADFKMVSSTLVREIGLFGGGHLEDYVSPYVAQKVRERMAERAQRQAPPTP